MRNIFLKFDICSIFDSSVKKQMFRGFSPPVKPRTNYYHQVNCAEQYWQLRLGDIIAQSNCISSFPDLVLTSTILHAIARVASKYARLSNPRVSAVIKYSFVTILVFFPWKNGAVCQRNAIHAVSLMLMVAPLQPE